MGALYLNLEAKINPGQKERLRNAMEALGEDVQRNEPATFHYRTFQKGDRVWMSDAYQDAQAFVDHFHRPAVQNRLQEIMECCTIDRVVVLGEPDAEAREILDGFGAVYAKPWTGFSRSEKSLVRPS